MICRRRSAPGNAVPPEPLIPTIFYSEQSTKRRGQGVRAVAVAFTHASTTHVDNAEPLTVDRYVRYLAERHKAILGDDFVGFYLHGSLAMGCFNPPTSDIDFLVVVGRSIDKVVKRRAIDLLLAGDRRNPTNPIEMSVLLREHTQAFEHPAPFALHYGREHAPRYASDLEYFCENGRDPDQAAHIVAVKTSGKCIIGTPIEEVFGEVPEGCYFDSIAADSLTNTENILRGPDAGTCSVPVYGVLNLCRVLAYIAEGALLSKAQGGEWGLANLPDWCRPVVREACNAYTNYAPEEPVDCAALKRYAEYGQETIERARAERGAGGKNRAAL